MKRTALLVVIAASVIVAWGSLPRAAEDKPAVLEYVVTTTKSGAVDTPKALNSILAANAKEGWEFCDCIQTGDSDLFVFKRVKP